MLPDEMEAEKNRKIILSLTDKINLMKKNVKELQSELNAAYKRIKELKENECSCGLLEDVHATEDY